MIAGRVYQLKKAQEARLARREFKVFRLETSNVEDVEEGQDEKSCDVAGR
jgi:hypothetical protein